MYSGMKHYCRCCNKWIDEPSPITEGIGGGEAITIGYKCPHCGEEIREYYICPCCGGPMLNDEEEFCTDCLADGEQIIEEVHYMVSNSWPEKELKVMDSLLFSILKKGA